MNAFYRRTKAAFPGAAGQSQDILFKQDLIPCPLEIRYYSCVSSEDYFAAILVIRSRDFVFAGGRKSSSLTGSVSLISTLSHDEVRKGEYRLRHAVSVLRIDISSMGDR